MSGEELAQGWVKQFLRVEMTRRKITYQELSARLALLNVTISEHALRNKISRGTFSAAFFIYCLEAMEVDRVELDYIDQRSFREMLVDKNITPVRKSDVESQRKTFDEQLLRDEVKKMIDSVYKEYIENN